MVRRCSSRWPSSSSWCLLLWLWTRRRRRKRREAEFAAARRVDPADPNALAAVPIDALDDLSKSIVVDVDNAVRTSDNELALGRRGIRRQRTPRRSARPSPTRKRHWRRRSTSARSSTTPFPRRRAQRRDLLTRVIVAAAKADRELDAQREAFEQLRDLVINAPDPAGRDDPADGRPDRAAGPVAAGAGRAAQAVLRYRAGFGGRQRRNGQAAAGLRRPEHHQRAAACVARPAGSPDRAGRRRSARRSRRWARRARCWTRWTAPATDINRAIATLPAAIADIQNGIKAAADATGTGQHRRRPTSSAPPATPRSRPSPTRRASGTADPLGAFTKLTQADAELDRLLASVAEEREAAERLSRAFDQALFTAQSRVRAVSDFIDTRRGSIGPEARTRLAEAVRQLQAAQDKQGRNLNEAIAHANGAAMLAAQAQSTGQLPTFGRRSAPTPGGTAAPAGPTWVRCIGGIIIGNILSRRDARRHGRQHGRRLELDVIRRVRLVRRRSGGGGGRF